MVCILCILCILCSVCECFYIVYRKHFWDNNIKLDWVQHTAPDAKNVEKRGSFIWPIKSYISKKNLKELIGIKLIFDICEQSGIDEKLLYYYLTSMVYMDKSAFLAGQKKRGLYILQMLHIISNQHNVHILY